MLAAAFRVALQSVYAPANILFLDESQGSPTSYTWNPHLPSGELFHGPDPLIFFPAPGSYDVTLTVTDDTQTPPATDSVTHTVTLSKDPISDLIIVFYTVSAVIFAAFLFFVIVKFSQFYKAHFHPNANVHVGNSRLYQNAHSRIL